MNFEVSKTTQKQETGETVKKSINFEVLNDAEEVAQHTAQRIVTTIVEVNNNPNKQHVVLLLPTGKTPGRMYEVLTQQINDQNIDTSKIVIARVEGFAHTPTGYDHSFDDYVVQKFFNKIGLAPTPENFLTIENLVTKEELQVLNEDSQRALIDQKMSAYDQRIKDLGGIDIAVLGLGGDAHVADVQPNDMKSKMRALKVRISRAMNIATDFDEYTNGIFKKEYAADDGELPSNYFVTLGLAPIHQAKEIIVMATGEGKAQAVKMGYDEATKKFTESNTKHNLNPKNFGEVSPFGFLIASAAGEKTKVSVLADKSAASLITNKEENI